MATLHKYKSVTHKNEAFFSYFFGKFEQIQRIFSCFLNLRKIPCVVIKISIGLFKNNSLSLQPDMCNEELDIIWCIMWNYLPFNRNKQWESGADWVKISSFFNPLWTEVGGPMDPKRNSFVDYFCSSMFKKLRSPCKFFFLFPKMSSVGQKRGLGSIGYPHSCLRWFFEDQKTSNNFFDLTYGCYNII